jgi:hypothetical protein
MSLHFLMRREHIERRLTLAQALAQEDGVPELAEHGRPKKDSDAIFFGTPEHGGDRTKADEQASIRSLPSHGTNQHDKRGHYNIMSSRQGNSAAYLVARLASLEDRS